MPDAIHKRTEESRPAGGTSPARHFSLRNLLVAALMLAAGGFSLALAEHPPLPPGSAASCSLCHDDKGAEREDAHAPVAADCTTCHEVNTSDTGTEVTLMAEDPDLCLLCHDTLQKSVDMDLASPHAAVALGCTTCHDPHVADEEHLLNAGPADLCQTCHDIGDLADSHSNQLTGATDCRSCHLPHGSDNPSMLKASVQHLPFSTGSCSACHREPMGNRTRLRSRGERLCTACHGDITGGEAVSTHAALDGERGKAGCLNCHDPHMSDQSGLLTLESQGLCGTCHEPITSAAMADSGHAAAATDCLTCHQPHAADQPRLLTFPKSEMCQACHDTSDADLATVHMGADLNSLSCTSCHDPHGTGNDHLLARVSHAALSMGCDTCHGEQPGSFTADSITELCTACHSDVAEAAAAATVTHAAMELADCTACHNPHASSRDSLVRGEGGEPCISCHTDQEAGKGEHSHSVIGMAGCQSCHFPHGGENPALLRATEPDLCLACHDSSRLKDADAQGQVTVLDSVLLDAAVARVAASLKLSSGGEHGHPMVSHRVLGQPTEDELKNTETLFHGEFTCSTCHTPHKSQSLFLFAGDVQSRSEACNQCHLK